ncbi:unnamed protein product [Gulo gulo]|uniref:Uncharacterized protein n=1 Tax=Gulo gulo TaxID=48420 RepID=A0A9X9ME45_GULGU|nr:unnamed protein product [Gulo gulo]
MLRAWPPGCYPASGPQPTLANPPAIPTPSRAELAVSGPVVFCLRMDSVLEPRFKAYPQ